MKLAYKIIIALWLITIVVFGTLTIPVEYRVKETRTTMNSSRTIKDIDSDYFQKQAYVHIGMIGTYGYSGSGSVATEKYTKIMWNRYWLMLASTTIIYGIIALIANIFSRKDKLKMQELD